MALPPPRPLQPSIAMQSKDFGRFKYGGRVFPNGEFSVGWKRVSDLPRADESDGQAEPTGEVFGIQMPIVFGGVDDSDRTDTPEGLPPSKVSKEEEGGVAIGLSNLPNSHTRVRGLKGITSYGRKMVRNGAYLLEKRFGRKNLSFLTLTLPSLSEESWQSVCENWGEVVRVFSQWLNRRLERNGLPSFTVSCTELQEERSTRTGEPALHLHALFVGRTNSGKWALTPRDVRGAWQRAVAKWLSPADADVSFSSSERLESVRKSASGYMGKYMSKGLSAVASVSSKTTEFTLPHTWYNLSAPLRKWVLSNVIVLNNDEAQWLATEELGITSWLMSYRRTVKIPNGTHKGMPIAVVGTLNHAFTIPLRILTIQSMMVTIYAMRMAELLSWVI